MCAAILTLTRCFVVLAIFVISAKELQFFLSSL